MSSLDLRNQAGESVGTVELDPAVFDREPHVAAMHQVVTAQLAAARVGTAKTKTRAEVSGGGAKPWRQKGTGRARQGSTRAPHWVGGGVAHGPTGDENHTKRVPKKVKRLALRSALSDRRQSGDLWVVDEVAFDRPRTKDAQRMLEALGVNDRSVLLVLARWDDTVRKSFRNLPRVHLLPVDQLNTYDVLANDVVLVEQAALPYVGTGSRADQEDTPGQAGAATTGERATVRGQEVAQ